ncbi:MAG: hypothetical protein U9P49_09245 [Thermodesulfobacteriota bacterium]|nr:hypothetical protein [Thermodesulfobacteriota bacterium]
MWAEISGCTIIMGSVGLIAGLLGKRIAKTERCKQDKTVCHEIRTHIEDDLEKGDAKFEKIIKTLGTLNDSVIRMEEQIKHKKLPM